MTIKLYNKRGKKNYKEAKLLRELEPIIEKKIKDNPELADSFRPANSFEELKSLHERYAVEDADFVEIKNNDMAKNISKPTFEEVKEKTSNLDSMAKEKDEEVNFYKGNEDYFNDMDDDSTFIDPFNRQEPTTYDYTLEGGLQKDEVDPTQPIRTDFAEPLSFDDAFELPDESEDGEPVQKSQTSRNQKERPEPKPKRERPEPINPSFDEMSGSAQKKSTKKFAKYIVEAVCALSEKGFVWYANKDINDAKLAEYELNGEMDLSILVTLENGQEATVKQFFRQQALAAEQLAKFEEEEKKDMAEALAEVFLEKGIAPSKTQELLIIVGGVLIKKGAILLSLKSQTNSLLDQLRAMGGSGEPAPVYEQNQQPAPVYEQPAPIYEQTLPVVDGVPNVTVEELVADEDMLEIEQVVQTKE
jgi:hypothetical protein